MVFISLTKEQKGLLAVYGGVATDMLGLTMAIPVFTPYSMYLGAAPSNVGLLFSVATAGTMISALFVGKAAAKFGRKAVFVVTSFGAAFSFLGAAMSLNFPMLVGFRALGGLASGTIPTSYSYVGAVVPPKDRPRYMAYLASVMSTTFIIGPLIGGGLAIFGMRVPFFASFCFALLSAFNAVFFITNPEDLKEDKKDATDEEKEKLVKEDEASDKDSSTANDDKATKEEEGHDAKPTEEVSALQAPPLSPWFNWKAMVVGGVGVFLNTLCYISYAVLLPFWLQKPSFKLVEDLNDITDAESKLLTLHFSYLMGLYGLVQVVSMTFIFPRLIKKLGLVFTAAVGTAGVGICTACIPLTSTYTDLLPITIFIAASNGLTRPTFPAFMSSIADSRNQTEYISIISIFMNLALVFGGQLTVLYSYNNNAAFLSASSCNFFNTINLCVCGYIFYKQAREKEMKEKEETDSKDVELAEGDLKQGDEASETDAQRKRSRSSITKLEKFFGFDSAMAEEAYFSKLVEDIKNECKKKNLHRGLTSEKGQIVINQIILDALPQAPDEFEERMEFIYQLYGRYGHQEWGIELSEIAHLKHPGEVGDYGLPGRA